MPPKERPKGRSKKKWQSAAKKGTALRPKRPPGEGKGKPGEKRKKRPRRPKDGANRPPKAEPPPPKEKIFSRIRVADGVTVERKQESSGSKKPLIWIILAVVILGGAGGGVYFVMFHGSEPEVRTTPAPAVYTTTTRPKAPTTAPPLNAAMKPTMSEEKWKQIRGACGIARNKPNLGRIVGGAEVVKHSWPWQIGLLKYKRYDANTASVKAICGGSLVGPRFIITAAHCFLNSGRSAVSTDANAYRVLVGGHDKGKETHGAKMLEIETISHHPGNNLATFTKMREIPRHDITVLVLKTVVDPNVVSPMTAFACLPRPYEIPPVNKKCWATGWGKTQGTGFDKVLKQVVQPIASEMTCKKKYGSKGIFKSYHLCAGPHKGSEGTCQGDSGGPLVCQYDDGVWVLHGDTSFGPKPCGISPGVWAQVSYHMEWVCCILKGYGPCREIKCKPS